MKESRIEDIFDIKLLKTNQFCSFAVWKYYIASLIS